MSTTDNVTYRGTVYPWHCDHMGHMNVMHYVGKFDEATWNLFEQFGLTPAYVRDNALGMAAVQQNIQYKRELLPGDTVFVRSEIKKLTDKALTFVHTMVHGGTGEVAAIAEMTGVHLDQKERKAVPFADDIRTRAEALITGGKD